jgi:carboxymethylenebutenolidase
MNGWPAGAPPAPAPPGWARRQQVVRRVVVALALAAVVTFLPTAAGSGAQAPAEEVTFPAGALTLRGLLYKPDGPGPFPAVLWNHGSQPRPSPLAEVSQVFTNAGYVFFLPRRRGQGGSPGPYIMDELRRVRRDQGDEAWSRAMATLLEQQVDDQLAGFDYLRSLPYVDRDRLAIAGCSFGGVQTVLAAERNPGIRAAIDFAGAAHFWQYSPELRSRLLRAAAQITVPTLFIQAANDYDLAPTYALSRELDRLGREAHVLIYPPFGTTAPEGHSFCGRGSAIWGPDVLAFLADKMR